MKLVFNRIALHNFASYNHAELELGDKGYCLVKGENNCKADNALSNGSGKSMIWNGICFTITGTLLNGVSKNLKNINIDEDLSYTSLDFDVDGINYVLTRYISPKSDLKIIKNNADISGKGIKESTAILQEELPDLNKELIATGILIGQGMPDKFSSHSPSGRKELLEKLTKSDFMIEDIKRRVAERSNVLAIKQRDAEDVITANNGKKAALEAAIQTKENQLMSLVKPDFEAEIAKVTASINSWTEKMNEALNLQAAKQSELDAVSALQTQKISERAYQIEDLTEKYNNAISGPTAAIAGYNAEIRSISSEINRIANIKDVCPTCGQKLQNVEKPSTEKLETERVRLTEELNKVKATLAEIDAKQKAFKKQISDEFDDTLKELSAKTTTLKAERDNAYKNASTFRSYLDQDKATLAKLEMSRDNWDASVEQLKKDIIEGKSKIADLDKVILAATDNRTDIVERREIIKKMENLIKRDFRGFLLENIIKYLDMKSKDYSELVFGTRELAIVIDGNNLDITYCGKVIDNLSGGERTRVDLILQLAIRDLMCNYFGYSSNILVLDEVTDFLDAKSCEAVMNFISTQLQDIASVFIISHHAEELDLAIDCEIKVVKDENAISTIA